MPKSDLKQWFTTTTTTCSHGNHSGHTCCELDKQAEVCKTKLEQICEDTDGLIHVVKQATDKTTRQVKQAEADIDDACENVKSAFNRPGRIALFSNVNVFNILFKFNLGGVVKYNVHKFMTIRKTFFDQPI